MASSPCATGRRKSRTVARQTTSSEPPSAPCSRATLSCATCRAKCGACARVCGARTAWADCAAALHLLRLRLRVCQRTGMARPSLGSPLSAHSGTLVGKLQALQARHLDATLPRLCSELRGEAGRAEAALEALPTAAVTVEQRRWRLHQVVQECNHSFGELITASDTSSRHELHVAARSHELCVAFVQRVCERIPNFLSDEALADLAAQVGETRGVYLPNFLNGAVFRRVIKQTFEEPLQQAASQLVEELSSTVKTALSALLATGAAAHPSLRDQLDALAAALVDKERDAAAALAREKVEAEMCAPFTINRCVTRRDPSSAAGPHMARPRVPSPRGHSPRLRLSVCARVVFRQRVRGPSRAV
mmetsp:Transcript_42939/g.113361  ORF Transcript_42939/g.113361 Transcript_42939/m.113361 type:complete len:362 (+) Transcript_42939:1017-2102(+)